MQSCHYLTQEETRILNDANINWT